MNDGDTHNGPSEQVEAKYPLLVERYALRPDSGGAGRFRGGLGCEQVVQARHTIRFNSQMDRVKCKPWGLDGGLSGFGNGGRDSSLRHGARSSASPTARRSTRCCTPATPTSCAPAAAAASARRSTRDLAALERDVRCGYVSKEAAEKYYGAVFEPATRKIDAAATESRRAEMRAQGLPHDEPIADTGVPPPAPSAGA